MKQKLDFSNLFMVRSLNSLEHNVTHLLLHTTVREIFRMCGI